MSRSVIGIAECTSCWTRNGRRFRIGKHRGLFSNFRLARSFRNRNCQSPTEGNEKVASVLDLNCYPYPATLRWLRRFFLGKQATTLHQIEHHILEPGRLLEWEAHAGTHRPDVQEKSFTCSIWLEWGCNRRKMRDGRSLVLTTKNPRSFSHTATAIQKVLRVIAFLFFQSFDQMWTIVQISKNHISIPIKKNFMMKLVIIWKSINKAPQFETLIRRLKNLKIENFMDILL